MGKAEIQTTLVLCLLVAAASSQRTYGFLRGNEALERIDWQPSRYEPWSSVFRNIGPGATVTIPAGRAVRVDVESIPRLSGLRVDGLLFFPHDSNLKVFIQTGYVLVRGVLRIGHAGRGMTGRTEVTFELLSGRSLVVEPNGLATTSESGPTVRRIDFGPRAFAVFGGQLEVGGLSSKCHSRTWTTLAQTVQPGASEITLSTDLSECLKVGMELGIAPSGYNHDESERRTITAINGRSVRLNAPLSYMHTGKNEDKVVNGITLEFGAEVIIMTRAIKIRSDNAGRTQGGHLMVAHTSTAQLIQGVEFTHMGQRGTLGRYPIHAHLCGRVDNFRIKGNSVHDSSQRGIVLHATSNVKVRDNVLFFIQGHAIMVAEDNFADGNSVDNNVVMDVKIFRGVHGPMLPMSSDDNAAGVWVGNPKNYIRKNRAAGCEKSGIWYEMKRGVQGAAAALPGASSINPRQMSLTKFVGNVAHSCGGHGVRFYPEPWSPVDGANYANGLKSYRNGGSGLLLHAHKSTNIVRSAFYENISSGVDFDRSKNCTMIDSVIAGDVGKPGSRCPSKAGIEFPAHKFPEDSPGHFVENTAFDGFRNCRVTPFTIDEFDRPSAQGWLGSLTLKNCPILDRAEPISMADVTSGTGNYWDKDVMMNLQGTAGVRNGFFLTDNSFNAAVGGGCSKRWGGLVCDNKCYRSVMFLFGGLAGASNYQIRVRRVADGRIKMVPANDSGKFYFNVEGNQAYEISLIRRNGARVPNYLQIEMADTNYACDQGIDLRFNLEGFQLRPNRFGVIAEPVTDCGRERATRPTFYQRCERGRPQTVIRINGGPLPNERPRGVRIQVTPGTPRCAANSC